MEDEKTTIGTLEAEITVDVNYAKTLQTVIDNCNTDRDVNDLFIDLLKFDKVNKVASFDNVNENLSMRIKSSNHLIDEIRKIVNGLIEENKKLKA